MLDRMSVNDSAGISIDSTIPFFTTAGDMFSDYSNTIISFLHTLQRWFAEGTLPIT